MKAPSSLGTFVMAVLSLLVSGILLFTPARTQQPGGQGKKDAPHEEARLFRLKHVQAPNMIELLHQLQPTRDWRVTAASNTTLASVGSADALAKLQKLIETLDVQTADEPRQEALGFQ